MTTQQHARRRQRSPAHHRSVSDFSSAPEVRCISPATSALLLIEFQNDFCTEGGKAYAQLRDELTRTDLLRNTRKLLARARAAGCAIVHVPYGYSEHYRDASETFGVLSSIGGREKIQSGEWAEPLLMPGTWGARFAPGVGPDGDKQGEEREPVVSGKHGLDSFAAPSDLEQILRERGIATLLIAGLLANCCIESTMRSAYERGYMVYTLTDCVAAMERAAYEGSIRHNFPLFSRPVRSIDVHFSTHSVEPVNAISHVRAQHELFAIGARAMQALPGQIAATASLCAFLTPCVLAPPDDEPVANEASPGVLPTSAPDASFPIAASEAAVLAGWLAHGGPGLGRLFCAGAVALGGMLVVAAACLAMQARRATSWGARAAGRASVDLSSRLEAQLTWIERGTLVVDVSGVAVVAVLATELDAATVVSLGCSVCSIAMVIHQEARGYMHVAHNNVQRALLRVLVMCGARR